eukprot:1144609-Pelagomonas_calceolata.AAC.4
MHHVLSAQLGATFPIKGLHLCTCVLGGGGHVRAPILRLKDMCSIMHGHGLLGFFGPQVEECRFRDIRRLEINSGSQPMLPCLRDYGEGFPQRLSTACSLQRLKSTQLARLVRKKKKRRRLCQPKGHVH